MRKVFKMICEKCNTPMVIDEWNGWVWTCFHYNNTCRPATNKEVAMQEKEYNTTKPEKGGTHD
jgi:ssDNA-binding Zn-finger/Zn-ribbon topoisomerase 1